MASSFPSDLADSGLKGLLPLPGMLLLLCSLVLVSVSGAYDDPYRDAGAAAFAFLKIEASARAAALGSTGLLNAGAMGLFANPALVAGQSSRLSATHNEWLGSAREDLFCWAGPVGPIYSSLGARILYVDGLEYREDEASSEPVSTFSAYDISFQGAAALRLGKLDVGLGAKVLREKIWRRCSSP